MGNEVAKTACSLAWDYPNISLSGNRIKNCCRGPWFRPSPSEIKELGPALFTNYEPILNVKRALIRGERHSSCAKCFEIEDKGMISQRTNLDGLARYVRSTDHFQFDFLSQVEKQLLNLSPEQEEAVARLHAPRLIEISLDNTCDLKCVYCNSTYSTQWASEDLRFGDTTQEKLARENPKVLPEFEQAFWDWFESYAWQEVDHINFIGGEPLIIEKYYEYMDRIISKYQQNPPSSKLTFSVVTNLNTPMPYLIRFLRMLRSLLAMNENISFCIKVSVESTNDRAQFIRSGKIWSRFESNLGKLLMMAKAGEFGGRFTLDLIPSINSLCVSDLPQFYQWVADMQNKYGVPIGVNEHQVVYPAWSSVMILPVEYTSYIDQSIEVVRKNLAPTSDVWQRYCDFLIGIKNGIQNSHKEVDPRREFARRVDLLSHRRNLDFAATFPEMMDFYNLCKSL